MSMAKRQQDLKDSEVRKRIEEFLEEDGFWKGFRAWAETEDGKASRAWIEEKEKAMAEVVKVRADGEHVVIMAEGEAGTCEVKLTFAETERFEEALDKARKRIGLRIEKRRSHEAMKVSDVDEEDFEEAE